jgi:hypothetical protein
LTFIDSVKLDMDTGIPGNGAKKRIPGLRGPVFRAKLVLLDAHGLTEATIATLANRQAFFNLTRGRNS